MIPADYCFLGRWRALVLGLAALITILSGAGCGSKGSTAGGPAALGEIMGKKTAELMGGHGSVVLLISELDNEKSEGLATTMAAFKKALGKSVTVSAVENLHLRPMPGLPPFSPQSFSEVLQKYATSDALVSFVMLPVLTPENVRQLPSPRPKVVLMVGGPLKNLFAQGVVSLAALPKPAAEAGAQPHTAQEWFDARYQLVTPDTAGMLSN